MAADPNSAEGIALLADRLFEAERARRPVPPLTNEFPGLSLVAAYRIQQANIDRRIAAGDSLAGHKIGLTSKAMQEKFGVDVPDYGHLLESMWLPAGQPLDLGQLIDPQIEVEPAFVLGRDLAGPGLTIPDVLAATEFITVCFEVIDSRIIDWQIKLQDTVADNGSSARFVLGETKLSPDKPGLEDLHTELSLDGQVVATGSTGAILGHPANGIVWLGNTLAEYGVTLEAGHVVLPGTCIRSFRVGRVASAGARIAELGEVRLDFRGRPAVSSSES